MFKLEKLTVGQKSVASADLVYRATRPFPDSERFGLTNQLRRAATSIASNLAEGRARPDGDFVRFMGIATGSLYGVVTQAQSARNQGCPNDSDFAEIHASAEEIGRMLSGLRDSLCDASGRSSWL